jgi:GDPmannose 4,6-dehydratase
MDIIWKGEGLDEIGVDTKTNKTVIKVDKKYFRPAEVENLLGDPTKAKEKLGWEPLIDFEHLVQDMCVNEH